MTAVTKPGVFLRPACMWVRRGRRLMVAMVTRSSKHEGGNSPCLLYCIRIHAAPHAYRIVLSTAACPMPLALMCMYISFCLSFINSTWWNIYLQQVLCTRFLNAKAVVYKFNFQATCSSALLNFFLYSRTVMREYTMDEVDIKKGVCLK